MANAVADPELCHALHALAWMLLGVSLTTKDDDEDGEDAEELLQITRVRGSRVLQCCCQGSHAW